MGTPLYNTDIIPLTSRPTLTVMDDGDYFVILDTSTGKISKILKTLAMEALKISYDNTTSGLNADTVQAALDELVVNLGSSDSAILALSGRLDTLEGTGEGSVFKAIDDALGPIEARVDTTELTLARQGQDLASVKQTLQQGNGATLDFNDIGIVPLDARATGRANPTVEGRTATNLVVNGDFSDGTTGWESFRTYSILSIVSGNLRATYNKTKVYFGTMFSTIIPETCKEYLVLRIRGNKSASAVIKVNKTGVGLDQDWTNAVVVTTEWQTVLLIKTTTESISGLDVDGTGFTSVGDWIEIDGNYGVTTINLTQTFGAGNEPDLETCQKLFSNYFDGTKSIPMPARVRSVGANIASYMDSNWWKGDLGNSTARRTPNSYPSINISKHPEYVEFTHTEISGAFIGVVYTIPISGNSITIKSTFEKLSPIGTLSRFYAFFKTFEDTLSSDLYLTKGGLSDSTTLTVPEDAQWINIGFYCYSEDASVKTARISNFIVSYKDLPYEPYKDSTLYIADNEEVRSFGATTDLVKVVNGEFVLEKNVNDDATAVISPPIITPLLTSGILQAKPNGTVYFEPYYEGSHQTDASSQITLPYEGMIDKLTGYDENLEPYEVPSTGYTLVGTLLTITGAEENEVFYVELSRSEPLAPEMEVNVLNNEQVVADTNNGKFYKLVPTITDGVLVSQTPVEVL